MVFILKTDIALIAILVFRVKFNVEFTRQAVNFSIEMFGTELGLFDTNQQKGSTDSIQTPDTSRTEYQGSIDSIQTHENITRL